MYLWTLPMFHCNGWCFPWTMAASAGTNVFLRKVEPAAVFRLIRQQKVTHYCGAPIVHSTLMSAAAERGGGISHKVSALVAGAAPPAALIESMERVGFDLTHVYGLTETYGPAAVCAKHEEWADLDLGRRAQLNARQGVPYLLQEAMVVMDPAIMKPVPPDGRTMGEIMFRGNITMRGYLKDPEATEQAFAGGVFHTGDLAVTEPDGYVRIKDRSKDIIVSGGENISSLEVEEVLHRHPAVMACGVVARPDPRWGETPCAFAELRPGAQATESEIIEHCRATWRASRRRARSSSAPCRARPPARSRSACCASRRERGRLRTDHCTMTRTRRSRSLRGDGAWHPRRVSGWRKAVRR